MDLRVKKSFGSNLAAITGLKAIRSISTNQKEEEKKQRNFFSFITELTLRFEMILALAISFMA